MQYDLEQFKADYDWESAFGVAGADVKDVAEVLAADPGENDGAIWICVCRMNDGRFCVMRAGCDYTGWDCQASGTIELFATLAKAVSKITLTVEEQERLRTDIEERGIQTDW